MKITSAQIRPEPTMAKLGLPGQLEVHATFEDGSESTLFAFYPDELRFQEAEFVGLTEEAARTLHHNRDVEWLRS